MKRLVFALSFVLLVAPPRPSAQQPSVPTPSEVLKIKIGDDGVLATYEQIVSYFRAIDPLSDRITVEDLGPTTMGHPMINAIITSPENMKKLDYYRDINNRLYDPRRTNEDEAKRLIAEGKTIVAIQMSIHSTEVAATQVAMELLYRYATDDSPRTRAILDNTIILLMPSHNPDGTQMVAEWNTKTLGSPYEGSDIPFLYHKYTGHDDNRDWYMFTQKESRMTVEKIWNRWHPQISYDMHQMGSNAARIFIPPYVDPWDPNVNPILISEMSALGASMAAELTGQGKDGVVIHGIYDGWTPARGYTNYHGGLRFLTEMASARLASPITLRFDQLGIGIGYDAKVKSWNFPRPWQGGTWRLRDIMDYENAAADALLEYATKYREMWLTNFYRVNQQAIGRRDPVTGKDKPFAIVFPASQRDPASAYKLLETLQFADLEVRRARAPFTADGKQYPAGTHVILMAQPASSFAKTLTEVQHYPDLRQYPGGPPQRPYDVTAYTMPLLMGVEALHVQQPFQADLELLTSPITAPAGEVGARARKAYSFAHDNAGIQATTKLTKAGLKVVWTPDAIVVPVEGQRNVHELVAEAAKELPLHVKANDAATAAGMTVRTPRVGLYKSYVASMDEGWTRWIFEQWGIDYTSLENKDVKAGNLRAKFDAIVLPQQAARQITNGFAAGSMPPEYVGGLGQEGAAALKTFVERGGTLVALDSASMWAVEAFGLPIKNVLQGLAGGGDGGGGGGALGPQSAAFYAPGSIVRTKVDVTSPIAFGSEPESIAWFEQSPAFEVSGSARSIVSYPASGSPLLSGWLLGAEKLNGKAAVVEVPVGQGRVILFGFRPQYRAQTWATFKLLFNSLYYATVDAPQASAGQSAPAKVRGLSDAGKTALTAQMNDAVKKGDAPAIVEIVVDREGVLYEGASGLSANAIFNIASMTKPVTSVAIMMLAEQGKLKIDDPVSKYLDGYDRLQVISKFNAAVATYETRPATAVMTIKHLLSHTSGIGYGWTNPIENALTVKTKKGELELPLLDDPGTAFHYSPSTRVLGLIVEKITGTTLEAWYQEHIFKPLGMVDTSYAVAADKQSRLAPQFTRASGTIAPLPKATVASTPTAPFRGDGGLYSTVEDYGKFVRMLLNGGTLNGKRILTEASVKMMGQNAIGSVVLDLQPDADKQRTKPFPLGAGKDKFGLGFQIAADDPATKSFRSPGSMSWAGIFNTEFWVDPVKHIGGVHMMQLLPFYDDGAIRALRGFEQSVYSHAP